MPLPGSIVTVRVETITQKFAKCSIICVGDVLLTHEFNSTLRKEDIREREKDKVSFVRASIILHKNKLFIGDAL